MDCEPVRVVKERVLLNQDALQELRERLGHVRLPPNMAEGWQQGVPASWLRNLLEDWRTFDTDALQDRLDGLAHLRATVNGQSIHLVHAPGSGADPVPLLMMHGWPGSFMEHLALLPLLSDPGSHHGDPGQAFTVVVASLPGFGFSGPPPPSGLTHRDVGAVWHRLMTEGLGYGRYVAHGSDLGAGVTAWLARDHPGAVAGIHLATPGLAATADPQSSAEQAYAIASTEWTAEEGG